MKKFRLLTVLAIAILIFAGAFTMSRTRFIPFVMTAFFCKIFSASLSEISKCITTSSNAIDSSFLNKSYFL